MPAGASGGRVRERVRHRWGRAPPRGARRAALGARCCACMHRGRDALLHSPPRRPRLARRARHRQSVLVRGRHRRARAALWSLRSEQRGWCRARPGRPRPARAAQPCAAAAVLVCGRRAGEHGATVRARRQSACARGGRDDALPGLRVR